MTSVNRVLVIGGGFAGCALSVLLRRGGVDVELVERKADFTVYGSGITLMGAALRVLREVGVWDELRPQGYEFSSIGLRNAAGVMLAEIPDTRTGGPDLPATLGAYRPLLAEVLADAAIKAGTTIRLGTTVTALRQDQTGVDATFGDGSTRRYDLVVGADGLRSKTRALIGIDLSPQSAGMGIWRVHAKRPADVVRTDLCYDGPCYIAGYCPTGPDTLYAYLVEDAHDRSGESDEQMVATMRRLAADYHGPWDQIRDDITDAARINYAWFESLLIDGPWNRGRAIVIGDAAHGCPPTLALGAAMALEDASVLAELLLGAETLDQSLFDAFTARRLERVRAVVDGSMQLVTWQLNHEPHPDVPGLMTGINAMISVPA